MVRTEGRDAYIGNPTGPSPANADEGYTCELIGVMYGWGADSFFRTNPKIATAANPATPTTARTFDFIVIAAPFRDYKALSTSHAIPGQV